MRRLTADQPAADTQRPQFSQQLTCNVQAVCLVLAVRENLRVWDHGPVQGGIPLGAYDSNVITVVTVGTRPAVKGRLIPALTLPKESVKNLRSLPKRKNLSVVFDAANQAYRWSIAERTFRCGSGPEYGKARGRLRSQCTGAEP
jgi:hypothetical protein